MTIGTGTTMAGVAALALILAGCGGEAAGNDSNESAAAAPVEQIPANLQQDPTNTVVPIGEPTAPAAATIVPTIPAPFRGRWGLVANDCDPAQADAAKGLVVVAGDLVTHYESRGRPTRIEVASPEKIVADLAYTGEGQEWTRRTTFTLLDDGRTLLAEVPTDPEPPMRRLQYSRCPA